jgi:hypothetical protein
MNGLTHLPLLLPLLFALPATLPEPEPATSTSAAAQDGDSMERPVTVFTPKYGNSHELSNTVNQLFSQGLMSEDVAARNLRAVALDAAIVVSGPQPFLDRAIELLVELDETSSSEPESEEMLVREYDLKHLTMDEARVVLRPLTRQHQEWGQMGMIAATDNISYLQSRGGVVVHDTQQRIDEIFGLLERLDVPRQQVLLRSYLIRGVDGGDDPRVPKEVTDSLRELVPYSQFELVSFAMLRSDVSADMGMTDSSSSAEYRMQLDPEAYDSDSQRLTFASCRFDITRVEGTKRMERQFVTSASLTAGEYTVLGGVGADADFLVLHMTLVDGP